MDASQKKLGNEDSSLAGSQPSMGSNYFLRINEAGKTPQNRESHLMPSGMSIINEEKKTRNVLTQLMISKLEKSRAGCRWFKFVIEHQQNECIAEMKLEATSLCNRFCRWAAELANLTDEFNMHRERADFS
ncbi:hypothetical protein D918_01256 [Trichuris suis]|nr:hypothetical protein D918_01256 [Trichuris suis]